MTSSSTHITVTVKVRHLPDHQTSNGQYFVYTLTIDNASDETWQLMGRHWEVQEAQGRLFMVDGEGVLGKQPYIAAGSSYTYSSHIDIEATPATMSGFYLMQNAAGKRIQVPIPAFELRLSEGLQPSSGSSAATESS